MDEVPRKVEEDTISIVGTEAGDARPDGMARMIERARLAELAWRGLEDAVERTLNDIEVESRRR